MKKLLLPLLALAACTSKPAYTPMQEKVIKLAQHLEPDSARYTPLRFGRLTPYTRRDSVAPALEQYTEFSDKAAEYLLSTEKPIDLRRQGHVAPVLLAKTVREGDSTREAYNQLMTARKQLLALSVDTVIGQQLTHTWRAGERMNSAQFVVYNSGVVKKLTAPSAQ